MSWLEFTTSYYSSYYDTTGTRTTFCDILFHQCFRFSGILQELKSLDETSSNYSKEKTRLKSLLSLYALNLLETRTGKVLNRSGLIQFDFDYNEIYAYDIGELIEAIYSLPFIAFVSRSCSGKGIYAFAMIAEPDKQKEYAEHCFRIFSNYGVNPDTSKGRNPNDLRYISIDTAFMKWREHPEPLKIERLITHQSQPSVIGKIMTTSHLPNLTINRALQNINNAQHGNRFPTVQKYAYVLGGYRDESLLVSLTDIIQNNPVYANERRKLMKCAEDCFRAGFNKPLK